MPIEHIALTSRKTGICFYFLVIIAKYFSPELRGQGEDLLEAGGAHHEAALHVGHAQGQLSGTFVSPTS